MTTSHIDLDKLFTNTQDANYTMVDDPFETEYCAAFDYRMELMLKSEDLQSLKHRAIIESWMYCF